MQGLAKQVRNAACKNNDSLKGVILSAAVLPAERRACPEPDGEGISRELKRNRSCVVTVLGLFSICLILGSAQFMSAQTAIACHPMDTRVALAPEKLPPPHKLTVRVDPQCAMCWCLEI